MSRIKCTPFRVDKCELERIPKILQDSKTSARDNREARYELTKMGEKVKNIKTKTDDLVMFYPVQFMWQTRRRQDDGGYYFEPNYANAFFFERSNFTYVILKSGMDTAINKFSQLLQSIFPGKVKNPDEFQVSSDFFRWLLYCYDIKNKFISNDIRLRQLSDYIGKSPDKTMSIKGQGESVLNLFSSKATLFSQENLSMLKITVGFKKNECNFVLYNDGIIRLNSNDCFGDFFESELADIEDILIIYYIYNTVIPSLKLFHKKNNYWTDNARQEYEEMLGQKLLDTIIEKLDIDINKPIKDVIEELTLGKLGKSFV